MTVFSCNTFLRFITVGGAPPSPSLPPTSPPPYLLPSNSQHIGHASIFQAIVPPAGRRLPHPPSHRPKIRNTFITFHYFTPIALTLFAACLFALFGKSCHWQHQELARVQTGILRVGISRDNRLHHLSLMIASCKRGSQPASLRLHTGGTEG